MFEDWCDSRNVKDLKNLKELVLLEEFKNCISKEIKTHLEELQVESLEKAAKLSDEYALTHKHFRVENKKVFSPQSKRAYGNKQHKADSTNNGSARELTCFHCGKKGHIKAKCFKYQKGNSKGQVKGAMLVRADESERETESLSAVRGPIGHKSDLDDFKWYVSVGSVLFPSCSEEVKVKILRDTASAQSLILETTLPEDMVVEGKESVLLGGFPDSVVACPLVTVCLDSSLVKGPVKVAVVKTLSVKGIDFVLGNDLAQNKVGTDQCCQSAEKLPNMRSKSEWDYKMRSYNSALSTICNATQIL